MLDCGKKISRFARQKKKYSNSCVVRKIFSERNKKPQPPPPPPFKLNGRSLKPQLKFKTFIQLLGELVNITSFKVGSATGQKVITYIFA